MNCVGTQASIQTIVVVLFVSILVNAAVLIWMTKMSDDKIERILSTYPPVEGRPGWVWFSKHDICKLEDLREAYKELFQKGSHEVDDDK